MRYTNVFLCAVTMLVLVATIGTLVEGKKKPHKNKVAGEKWLAEKAQEEGVHKLPSGLMFKILRRGRTQGKSPRIDDPCDVHYKGTLTTGHKFDSSHDRGSPLSFAPNQVIKGWTEALQLMREGEIWEVYIPYELGYGAQGSPPSIPAYAALVFEMELIKVKGKGRPGPQVQEDLEKKIGKKYEDL